MPYTPPATAASAIGLGNVDNTHDVDKPVSTAQATAIALNAPLASPAFTGTAAFAATGLTISDTNLYRSAADTLKTDDAFTGVGRIRSERSAVAAQLVQIDAGDSSGIYFKAEGGSAKPLNINHNGVAGTITTEVMNFQLGGLNIVTVAPGDKLKFGNAGDTNLYRSAADTLKTDDRLIVAGNSLVTQNNLTVGLAAAQGGIACHVTAPDVNTYPLVVQGIAGQATDLVRIWDSAAVQFSVTAAGVTQIASLRATGNVGFYNTAPVAKPAVTGSRGGNAAIASLLAALASQGLITDSSSA